MNTVYRENSQNRQVRDEDENIESVPLVQGIPVIAREKRSTLRGKDQSQHQVVVHLINMSPANVSSNRMLIYPFKLKKATLTWLKSCGLTIQCSQQRIAATMAIPAYAIHPEFTSIAVRTSKATVTPGNRVEMR